MTMKFVRAKSGFAARINGLIVPAEGGTFELTDGQLEAFGWDSNFELLDEAPAVAEPEPVADLTAAAAAAQAAAELAQAAALAATQAAEQAAAAQAAAASSAETAQSSAQDAQGTAEEMAAAQEAVATAKKK